MYETVHGALLHTNGVPSRYTCFTLPAAPYGTFRADPGSSRIDIIIPLSDVIVKKRYIQNRGEYLRIPRGIQETPQPAFGIVRSRPVTDTLQRP